MNLTQEEKLQKYLTQIKKSLMNLTQATEESDRVDEKISFGMNLTQAENDHGIIGHPLKTSQMYVSDTSRTN